MRLSCTLLRLSHPSAQMHRVDLSLFLQWRGLPWPDPSLHTLCISSHLTLMWVISRVASISLTRLQAP